MVKAADDHAAKLRLEIQLERAVKKISAHSESFAFGELLPAAPNPGLEIGPLGIIGLPLSVREAETIKKVAARSPFGHGDKLIVDSTVRDTWEIDGAQIQIRNAAWDSFMGDVVKMVRNGLGVAPSALPPKCELYKLLLYETGSHFLPHQDTEKAPGMFATIVIVLPSIYAGGEVRVVHGSGEKVLDFSGSSQLNTAVLAWYADVVHEVKPVTSGFRLALSYNLIQTGNVSIPPPPVENTTVKHLRQVFAHWSEGAYDSPPGIICYKLEHKYSQSNLSKGISCLKGVDANKVLQIKEATSSFDIEMGFGQFKLHVVKEDPEEDGYYGYASRYSKRRRFCRYDDGEEDEDEQDKEDEGESEGGESEDEDEEGDEDDETEIERFSTVSQLVDLEGTPIAPNATIDVNGIRAALIPKNAFKGKNPDDEEHEGYQGNAPGSIQQWYKRTVLILYLKKNEKRIMLEAGGVSYAVAQLKKASPVEPNKDTKAYAEYVLGVKSYDNENDLLVMNLAISWGDLSLWLKAANKCNFNADPMSIGWERVVAAWDKFGFEALRPSLEGALQSLRSLKQQMHVIDFIKSRSEERAQESIRDWCEQQTSRVLSSIQLPVKREDVPAYLSVVKSKGFKYFAHSIMPQLVKLPDTYGFFLDLVNTLHSQRKEFEDMSSPGVMQSVIHESLSAAIKQWKVTISYYTGKHIDGSRVKELAACLISAKDLALLKRLFESLIVDEADIRVKFRDVFIPLVPYLLPIQKKNNIPIDTGVCGDFYRWLIEKHLRDVLGPKKSMRHAFIKKIGCGSTSCSDCTELDRFMQSTDASHVFRYAEHRRKHLESRMVSVHDLVVHKTIRNGSPYGLEVTKNKEVVEWSAWMERQKTAKSFLVSFGGNTGLKDIMGDRLEDVVKALSGEKEYAIGKQVLQKNPKAPIKHARSISSGKDKAVKQTGAVTLSGSAMATKAVAGVKRKGRSETDDPIIDLTTSP